MAHTGPNTAATERAPRARIAIFRAREASDLTHETMAVAGMQPADAEGFAQALEAGLLDNALVRLLFEDEAAGVSLTYAWFKAHAMLPRHSHSANCLYYVVSGSLQFGNERLTAGDGFLVPANALYSYEAGPDGVEVLEFRTATHFDITFSGSAASWGRLVENIKLNRPAWALMPAPPAAQNMLARDAGGAE